MPARFTKQYNPPFIWSDSFSVGNAILDEQHKKILDIYVAVERLILEGRKDFSDALAAMGSYAKIHFETEERLLREVGYPDFENHAESHHLFDSRLESFNLHNLAGDLDPEELKAFIKDWFIGHILDSDMKYKPYLANKG